MNGCAKRRLVICAIFILCLLSGCKVEQTSTRKIKDLDYTICDERRLPEALVSIIEEKKGEPFRLTYRTKDYLYIVVGYGACDRTDLSVVLSDLYLTENAIFADTDLCVDESRTESESVSYPWIAVKCELYDVEVEFK